MNIPQTPFNTLAADARSLNALKLQAGKEDPQAIKDAARQFESLFMRELIKSMRDATMKSGMLDSPQGDLGSDLLDQQLSVQLSGQPGGLADIIARQLSRQTVPAGGATPTAATEKAARPAVKVSGATASQTGFVQRHGDAAAQVERESGIPASFMIGQAGHETGWGRSEIKMKGGGNSFNLFGIKAGGSWTGKVAEVTTTEYVNGVPRKMVAKFRAYDSYEDSFRDYAKLISESPRYATAAQHKTGSALQYASALQRAGYATDPEYATKLSRAINSTLRIQRAVQA